jgi:hypothetical protein
MWEEQMRPVRRELLNGLLVLIVASLLSAAFAAFQINFNVQLWASILMGISIAVGGYIVFDFVLSAEQRETEWLKRIGTPARFEVGPELGGKGGQALLDAIRTISPGSEYTVINYYAGANPMEVKAREEAFVLLLDYLRRGVIREYKRIICFDPDVLARDQELRSGVLRVGEGPGTIDKSMGEHCRLIMSMKGCSLFVAPALLQSTIILYGSDTAGMTVETFAQDTRSRRIAGVLFFCEPPNGEIIEQFRQMERETERRMVAVHKIRFPEDAAPTADRASR